jgi:transmembrane sensor
MIDPFEWPLIAKYLSGECTLQEINEVESWMVADTENRELIEVLKIAWNTSEPDIQTSDTHYLWQQFSEKADHISGLSQSPINTLQRSASETERKTFSVFFIQNPVWRYAAVFLVFFLATLYFFTGDITTLLGIKSTAALKTVSVENARRERVILSDGTIVTLDAGSQFRYPEKFNGNTREVYLTGEAYFEVTSHPEKPFTVFANQAAIEVLGTKFNVRAWQPEQRVIVTVAEGKVLFYPEQDKSQHSVTLNQGFSSSMRQAGLPTPPRRIDIQKSTGWMNNEVYFEDTPLVEILSQLERWYDVTFETRDSILINDRLTVYLADKPLENHLVLLGELADADFVGKGRHYQLIPR